MTNDEYYCCIEKMKNQLKSFRKEGLEIFRGIIGSNIFEDDLFFIASLDRCLRLMDGMNNMLENRNLTCAGAILRLQMDNCMRTYAAYIAADRKKVVNCLLEGNPINKEKDIFPESREEDDFPETGRKAIHKSKKVSGGDKGPPQAFCSGMRAETSIMSCPSEGEGGTAAVC